MIRQFTPNWFAATMGTGILALALPQVPGIGPALKPVGEALWFSTSRSLHCSPASIRRAG
jgi:tellurite resistance protein TehA-like permease